MKRDMLAVAAVLLAWSACAGQTAETQALVQQRLNTLRYLLQRHTSDGGFTPSANDKKPTLGATSSALRALKYFGGEAPDRDACAKFVASCFDKETGGFRQRPGEGKPDVFTTAVGIMAVAELKMPMKDYEGPVMAYLAKNAKTFEDVRIAAAGLEAIGKLPDASADWLKMLAGMRNEDGTYGTGEDQARATGGAVACQLRLGEKIKDPKAVLTWASPTALKRVKETSDFPK
jgi:prenyltransferase beta subunit